jgi:excisionase family DNA binding protein
MNAQNILIQASPEQLSEIIISGIREELKKFQFDFSEKTTNEVLLTREQVSTYLGCSKVSLWKWSKNKILIPIKLGRSIRYKKSEVERFINSKITN